MDPFVREGLLRLSPSHHGMLFATYYLIDFLSLAALCAAMAMEVGRRQGTSDRFQMVRVLAAAYIWRLMQCTMGQNKVPPLYYLREVLPFYDLPITLLIIAAFYNATPGFVQSPEAELLLAAAFLLWFITYVSEVRKLRRGISPTQGSSFSTELLHQQNNDAANNSISYTADSSQWETLDPIDVQVTDHFAFILLAALCVDLLLQLESLKGTCELFYIVMLLGALNFSRLMPSLHRPAKLKVSLVCHLQKVLLSANLPITAAVTVFYTIVRTFSKTLFLALSLELVLLALTHMFIPERVEFNKTKVSHLFPSLNNYIP
ncbi:uncharacterized protein LOC114713606 [Neltuma alba]|uniref:uncharacterized protein LOC114713606 n=1 Tax=Neltuma alba TaxID=207710 RepID=UPI0010A56F0C|nr:uncharacterized protein LOC114713606 [Prosopis alba]